ncbi:MAG TPA: cysteine--tRNA ligase [Bacteroidota bacterium]|nr:cysteine--tRNA ligase [Bacteroidota bacterium]
MSLSIYNSLTRKKEVFTPLHKGSVGMYVCGPTVYSDSHVGHAKSYVSFDIIVRYLRHLGYKVLYVQNITDVGHLLDSGEDRMLKQSKIQHVHPMQIAETITRSYFEDMDALSVVRPDISPRATGHIVEQIELVRQLLEKGFAYEVNGSVYFDVRKFKEYGKLSGRTVEEAVEGTRVGIRDEKRNPEDFALWKKAEPEHIMRWPSPWSEGFPGWHVECSAMSMKYLGETFDIHGGGLDNQFPHHEAEVAQSESATGKPFVKYWIHNNLVTVNGKKMSKSLGNFVTLKDLFKKFDPMAVRFFILQSHYRSTLDFSDEAMQGAEAGLEKLLNFVREVRERVDKEQSEGAGNVKADFSPYEKEMQEAMDDDFNAPKVIAALFRLATDVNSRYFNGAPLSLGSLKDMERILDAYGTGILGVVPKRGELVGAADHLSFSGIVELVIGLRAEARKQKQWALSDMIRDGLKELGIVIEDKKDGTSWRKS